MTRRASASDILIATLIFGAVHCGPAREDAPPEAEGAPSSSAPAELAGTPWRLLSFVGGNETTLRPDDPAKYTITLQPDGRLSARLDCNRGSGTWRSSGPPQLEFGPLALTRAMCPPGSMHDHLVKQWPYVRSYVIRNGHLFLSLMADGGIYELEPTSAEGSMQDTVRVAATYRERMALPPGAVLEATLEDVSRADAPAEVLGRVQVENPGNPPFALEIPYDSSRIDSTRSYAARARIVVEGKPFFLTDRHYPVLTRGAGKDVELLLRRARAVEGTETLENTYWRLLQLGGDPVSRDFQNREPHLILNSALGRATGSGGCNSYTGSYELNGDRLAIGQAASTMMACAKGMETERAFLQSLGRVARWRMGGKQLELLDDAGTVVARFEAVHME